MATVLVVEDDEQVRTELRALFEERGYSVIEAANGRQALTRLSQHEPQAVVLDLLLPWLSGNELLLHLRDLRPSLPIVVYSAAVEDPEVANLCLELGATRVCQKPYAEAVVVAVRELLEPEPSP